MALSPEDATKSMLSVGAIVGCVIAGIVGVCVVVVIIPGIIILAVKLSRIRKQSVNLPNTDITGRYDTIDSHHPKFNYCRMNTRYLLTKV